MKLLLDENLPHDLRHAVTGHEVFTVAYMGWAGLKNGELLRRAAEAGFDAILTNDSAIETQQDTRALPLAIVLLGAATNDLADILPRVPAVLRVLGQLVPRSLVRVE